MLGLQVVESEIDTQFVIAGIQAHRDPTVERGAVPGALVVQPPETGAIRECFRLRGVVLRQQKRLRAVADQLLHLRIVAREFLQDASPGGFLVSDRAAPQGHLFAPRGGGGERLIVAGIPG